MSLSGLPAAELARIDAICLEYESQHRKGDAPRIEEIVRNQGGEHAEILRRELELIRDELAMDATSAALTDSVKWSGSDTLPAAGTKLGPYVIEELLGRGGMGVVFKATDQRLNRTVAIKMLAVEIAKRSDLNERFQREARAVAAISHPNIVELFDVGSIDGLPYAVMEHLDGELLDRRLGRGKLSIEEVRRIGAQIADALATAHEAGVVHRDLKPHNVMLVRRRGGLKQSNSDSRGTIDDADSTIAKLFDFGLSRVPPSEFEAVADKSHEGMILGTPGYMAPEQARGESVTPAADIFSLGCILYEAFYGTPAFDGRNKAARMAATLDQDPVIDPVRRRDDIELANLIEQCLQKDPAARTASAAVIAHQLRSPGASSPIVQQLESGYAAGQLTRRRLLALAGGGLAGGIVAGVLALRESNELNQIRSIAVLSFADQATVTTTADNTTTPSPVGDRKLHRGEQLAALLVHELSRMSEITVPRFRPVTAETPSEFRALGQSLEVDAMLTGTIGSLPESGSGLMELDLQIISAKTGNQLWGKRIQSESGDNLLEQSRLATEIASVIGQRLTSTAAEAAPPNIESFSCLVDGKTRSDPDSLRGLEMALKCFQNAHDVDRRFADPIAGIALTSITLAAQTSTKKSLELIRQARERSEEALKLDPSSIDARLAVAMLDWQTVGRYEQAERTFEELVMVAPNDWQVQHQYGLLLLAIGQTEKAAQTLREASLLNPMSVMVKVDRARAAWFGGNAQRAIEDAMRIRDRYNNNVFARGLLVDIFESTSRFDEAADQHDAIDMPSDATPQQYYRARRKQLQILPYGPFGDRANEAIWKTRVGDGIDDLALSELTDPMPPMLPLLLAAHPSFEQARKLPRAKEILPARLI